MTPGRKSFGSDNHAGAHPEVIQAIAAANAGDAAPYGADELTTRTAADLCAAFGAAGAFFVFNGTAANVLGVSLLLQAVRRGHLRGLVAPATSTSAVPPSGSWATSC